MPQPGEHIKYFSDISGRKKTVAVKLSLQSLILSIILCITPTLTTFLLFLAESLCFFFFLCFFGFFSGLSSSESDASFDSRRTFFVRFLARLSALLFSSSSPSSAEDVFISPSSSESVPFTRVAHFKMTYLHFSTFSHFESF